MKLKNMTSQIDTLTTYIKAYGYLSYDKVRDEAERIKQGCGVEKAFIVAYDRAVKTALYQARDKNR